MGEKTSTVPNSFAIQHEYFYGAPPPLIQHNFYIEANNVAAPPNISPHTHTKKSTPAPIMQCTPLETGG